MCEYGASIWWKTVRWTQCNSYEGMWGEIQMPSRYLTNVKEKFYYPTPQDFLSTIHSLLIWKPCFHLPVHQALLGRLLEF